MSKYEGLAPDLREELLDIDAALEKLGFRMEASLSSLDELGDEIIVIATGEPVEDYSTLPPEVIALAEQWTRAGQPDD